MFICLSSFLTVEHTSWDHYLVITKKKKIKVGWSWPAACRCLL